MIVRQPLLFLLFLVHLIVGVVSNSGLQQPFRHSTVNSKLNTAFQKILNQTFFDHKDAVLVDKINSLISYDFEITLQASIGVFNIANLLSLLIISRQDAIGKSAALNILVSSFFCKIVNVFCSLQHHGSSTERELCFNQDSMKSLQIRLDNLVQMDHSQIVVYCLISFFTKTPKSSATLILIRELPFILRSVILLLISALKNSDVVTAIAHLLFSYTVGVTGQTNNTDVIDFEMGDTAEIIASATVLPFELMQGFNMLSGVRTSTDVMKQAFIILIFFNYLLVRVMTVASHLLIFLSRNPTSLPILRFFPNGNIDKGAQKSSFRLSSVENENIRNAKPNNSNRKNKFKQRFRKRQMLADKKEKGDNHGKSE